eukprot:gene1594-1748_t
MGWPPSPPARYAALATGQKHTCALRPDDGAAVCWGRNKGDEAPAVAVGTLPKCANGPAHGTYDPGCADGCAADLSRCDELIPGLGNSRCEIHWRCPEGYTSGADSLEDVVCGVYDWQYDGSAIGSCTPHRCENHVNGQDQCGGGVNYSDCVGKHTGQNCTPICQHGYHPSGSIALVCTSTFVYDANRTGCDPNRCTAGPIAGTADPGVDFMASDCNNVSTGQSCLPPCTHPLSVVTPSHGLRVTCERDG